MAINVAFAAYRDPRFLVLGDLIKGLESSKPELEAIGRTTAIWKVCIELGKDTLSFDIIDNITGINGYARCLIQSGLAEECDGLVRMKGLAGKMEWYEKYRQKLVAAGKIRAQQSARSKDGRFARQEASSSLHLDKVLDPSVEHKPLLSSILLSSISLSNTNTLVGVTGSTCSTHPHGCSEHSEPSTPTLQIGIKKKRGSYTNQISRTTNTEQAQATTSLWNYYLEKLSAKSLQPAPRSVKTNTWCKQLVKTYGLDKAKELVDAYMQDEDKFVVTNAYTLGLLVSGIQKYLNTKVAKSLEEQDWQT